MDDYRIYRTKYSSALVLPMKTFISSPWRAGERSEHVTWKPWQTPTGRINMLIRKPSNASLKDASSNNMNISGKGTSVNGRSMASHTISS